MSSQIDTIPEISPELIDSIQADSTVLCAVETQAYATLRKKYSPLAEHNGYIKIASQTRSDINWSREAYYPLGGKRLRGLLCYDSFTSAKRPRDHNRGTYSGSRLYLTESGEWLSIERSGTWSTWQGEAEGWACGDVFGEGRYTGGIAILSDTDVATRYKLPDILIQLAKTLGDMSAKLPERLTRIRQRIEIARKLLESLK